MAIRLKKLFFDNKILKINSLLIAFVLWSIISESFTINKSYKVPLIFYNSKDNIIINAPESIKIELKSKKSILFDLNKNNLAVYIDSKELSNGNNQYIITEKNLFLSPAIKLVDYEPRNLEIKISAQNKIN